MGLTPDQIGEYLEHQGATDDEIDEFLEHFGVRGMRWGVRRQKSETTQPGTNHSKRNKKLLVGAVATTAIGATLAMRMLRNSGQTKTKNLPNFNQVFSARGPRGEMTFGNKVNPDILQMLLKNLN